jgi:signal transduction histidine kinase
MRHRLRTRSNGDIALAPVLLLVFIVALPTAAVLWLMKEATQNERLAVRQRLTEVYRAQLETARKQLLADWHKSLVGLDETAAGRLPAQAFAACAGRGFADGVVVFDPRGQTSYPATSISPSGGGDDDADWLAAKRLEFTDRDYAAAARAYAKIARDAPDDKRAARAIQAQVRSLLVAGDKNVAVQLLREQIENPRLQAATDPGGRWLWADLMLLLIETAKDSDPPLARRTAILLASRLDDYRLAALGAVQRRFLMHELQRQYPERAAPPTMAAEDLAAEYMERRTDRTAPRDLQAAGLDGVWKVRSPGGRVLALFRTTTVLSILNRKLGEQVLPAGVRLAVRRPFDAQSGSDEFLTVAAGPELPQWKVSLALAEDPFEGAAVERGRFYLWTALLTIVATGSLALLVAAALRRQMRRSQLKNDLVATVSHELKTPLSSIRLLVDTLLDQQRSDPQQTREYLQLVARENERLSRLIDNFLTFSRIERGKQRFATAPVEPAEIARRAGEALHERLHEPNCQFEVRVEPELSPVAGDIDALVMALVNLLDNALKYSGPQKRIALGASSRANQVCFAVEDNGLGLSARHKRRVFDRFYQVNQQLTRAAGGCGLGLSIVRSIVMAHGGSVAVESELGKGSTFLVTLPAIPATQPNRHSKSSCTTS